MNNSGSVRRQHIKNTHQDRIFDAVNLTFLVVLTVLIIYPLYYVVVASFTDPDTLKGQLLILPPKVFFGGYKRIFEYGPLWNSYYNTLKYTVVSIAVSLGLTIPCAYALSRRDFYGRRVIMFLFTFTMFFSGGLIPLFLTVNNLGLYDSMWAVILPLGVSVYNLIICRSFFEDSIPGEMLEAAKLDGCSDFRFFFCIVLPLSGTILAVMALFYGVAMWNTYLYPLMFLSNIGKMPLSIVLRNLIMLDNVANLAASDAEGIAYASKLAAQMKYGLIVIAALPLLLLYPFLQRFFVKGILIGAGKG